VTGTRAYADKKRADAEGRRLGREAAAKQRRLADLENRIADREQAIKDLEARMAAPGFYDNREEAANVADRHQSLMWEVGSLMSRWEELQIEVTQPTDE
jgi:uncharacterized coiled-coil protein SlyX